MTEMEARGYHPDPIWKRATWRGNTIGEDNWMRGLDEPGTNPPLWSMLVAATCLTNEPLYREHNEEYLRECVELLKSKNSPMDFEKIEKELKLK